MLTLVERASVGRNEKPSTIVREQACRLPWAWNGLCFAVPFHVADNEGTRDIATNTAPVTRSNLAWTRDAGGNTAADMSNSAYLLYPDLPTHDRPSTELTVFARLKWAGTSDTYGGIVSNKISLSSPWSTWALNQAGTSSGQIEGQVTTAGVYWGITTSGVALLTSEVSNVFLRWRLGDKATLHVLSERGRTLSTADSGGALPTGSLTYQAGEAIRINASEDVAANFSGHYSQVMVWSRQLSTVEMQALTCDPFGWYAPRRESLVVASPFPVAPVSSSGSAQPMRPWQRPGFP